MVEIDSSYLERTEDYCLWCEHTFVHSLFGHTMLSKGILSIVEYYIWRARNEHALHLFWILRSSVCQCLKYVLIWVYTLLENRLYTFRKQLHSWSFHSAQIKFFRLQVYLTHFHISKIIWLQNYTIIYKGSLFKQALKLKSE